MTRSRPRGPGISTEVLYDGPDIDAMRGVWRELSVLTGNAFVGPEWFEARGAAEGRAAAVVVVRREATVIGVVPLEVEGRVVRFAGGRFGDHFSPAAAADDLCDVAGPAAAAIAAEFPGRHVVLDRVDLAAPWIEVFSRGGAGRTARTRLRQESLPFIDLHGHTWESWTAGQSRNFRGQLGRKERALVREHGATVRSGARANGLGDDLDLFFRLHAMRWTDRPDRSALLDDEVQALHRRFAAALHERGWLRLRFLEVDGEAVAAVYGWCIGGRWSYFNSGWDPQWAQRSVGFVLLGCCVHEAIDEGAAEFDLLLGDEPYKERFASDRRTVETLSLARPLSRAHVAARGEAGLRRAVQAMPPGLAHRLRQVRAAGKGASSN